MEGCEPGALWFIEDPLSKELPIGSVLWGKVSGLLLGDVLPDRLRAWVVLALFQGEGFQLSWSPVAVRGPGPEAPGAKAFAGSGYRLDHGPTLSSLGDLSEHVPLGVLLGLVSEKELEVHDPGVWKPPGNMVSLRFDCELGGGLEKPV